MRQLVPRDGAVAEDLDVVAVIPGLVVVHRAVHHGITRDVVTPVFGLNILTV